MGCTLSNNPVFGDLVTFIICNISKFIIPLIFALTLVMFIWGIVRYVIGANEEKERERGKQLMIWGIIALAVMVGVWGFVHIVTNTFNLDFGIPQLPQ